MAIMEEEAGSKDIIAAERVSGRRAFRFRKTLMDALPAVLFLAAILAIWKVTSGFMPPVLIPSPERVVTRFITMWSTPGFLSYAGMTVMHVVCSVAIAFVLGLVIALTVQFVPLFRSAVYLRLAPFLNAFPGVGWAFLALIWLGINSPAVIFASSAALLPLAIINLGAGLREMNSEALEMALSFSRNPRRRIWLVMLPLMFPYMFATLRLCFGVSWQIVLVVELLSGAPGLGAVVSVARQRYWTDMIFSVVALILIAVFVTDRLIFARLQSRIGKVYNV
jgi:NitT/TauT family transport system permease protein